MRLSEEDLQNYNENGFLVCPLLFAQEEVALLEKDIQVLKEKEGTILVYEGDDTSLRSIHGDYPSCQWMNRVISDERLLQPAMQILENQVYVHQFKINWKEAFHGDPWPWHQDTIFWREEDLLPNNNLINAGVFLDDVTEFNSPLTVIPGSHKQGIIERLLERKDLHNNWEDGFAAKLKYTVDEKKVAELAKEKGFVAPKGVAGSVLFFNPNIVHCSSSNMSHLGRRLLVVTYNPIDNLPKNGFSKRHEYLVGRNYTPLEPLKKFGEL